MYYKAIEWSLYADERWVGYKRVRRAVYTYIPRRARRARWWVFAFSRLPDADLVNGESVYSDRHVRARRENGYELEREHPAVPCASRSIGTQPPADRAALQVEPLRRALVLLVLDILRNEKRKLGM